MSRQFIEIFPGNEGQLNNSLDAADMELTKEDVFMLICYDSNNKLAPHTR